MLKGETKYLFLNQLMACGDYKAEFIAGVKVIGTDSSF